MKNKILFTLSLLFSIASSSQNLADLSFWKVKTKSRGVFVGISENKNDTKTIIQNLEYQMQGTKYEITSKNIIHIDLTPNQKKQAYVAFRSDHSNLKYKYISEIELISLQYVKDNNFDMAIKFYKSVSLEKYIPKINKHLNNLHNRYAQLLFPNNEGILVVEHSQQYVPETSAN